MMTLTLNNRRVTTMRSKMMMKMMMKMRTKQRMNDDEDSNFDRETECHSDGAAGEEDLDCEPTEREV